jgi:hypothetical protein
LSEKKNEVSIPFQLKNNLILIPVEINKQKFTFILDTGVSKTLLFNIKANDSVKLNNRQKVKIKGLGANEYYKGIRSTNNIVKINKIINPKATIYLITEADFDFSSRIGLNVHGLIGADLLKKYVVEIDYIKKKVKFIKPNAFKLKKKKKWKQLPIKIVKNKPYVSLLIDNIKANFLIDSGSSDALWIFENANFKVPNKNFDDYLGNGLSGEIHGKKAKLKTLNFGNFNLKNVLTAYPDASYINYSVDGFKRNGIIGGNILKRFKVILDYPKQQIFLKKNRKFKTPFYYNKTGLDITYNGKVLVKEKLLGLHNSDTNGNKTIDIVSIINFVFKDSYIITSVKKGSSADLVGLQKGDIVTKINGQYTFNYQLEEIIEKLSNNKKRITLTIDRNGIEYKFTVPLIDYL